MELQNQNDVEPLQKQNDVQQQTPPSLSLVELIGTLMPIKADPMENGKAPADTHAVETTPQAPRESRGGADSPSGKPQNSAIGADKTMSNYERNHANPFTIVDESKNKSRDIDQQIKDPAQTLLLIRKTIRETLRDLLKDESEVPMMRQLPYPIDPKITAKVISEILKRPINKGIQNPEGANGRSSSAEIETLYGPKLDTLRKTVREFIRETLRDLLKDESEVPTMRQLPYIIDTKKFEKELSEFLKRPPNNGIPNQEPGIRHPSSAEIEKLYGRKQ